MLKKLLNMIGSKIGLKSKDKTAEQKKAPIQSRTGPGTKTPKNKKTSGEAYVPKKSNFPGNEERTDNRRNTDKRGPAGNQRQPSPQKTSEQKPRTQGAGPNPRTGTSRTKENPQTNKPGTPVNKTNPPTAKPKQERTTEEGNKHVQKRPYQRNRRPQGPKKEPYPTITNKDVSLNEEKVPEVLGSETSQTLETSVGAVVDNWDPSTFQVPEVEGKSRFQDFDLPKEVMHAIAENNFQYCTPIQNEIMHKSLLGKDSIGQAQTGTGKTAAFLITIFSRLIKEPVTEERKSGHPRALVLAPTRELVMQIYKDAMSLGKYTNLNILAVYGGMDYKKQRNRLLAKPVDLIIATPGRLIDFYNRKELNLSKTGIVVIDEADRMLDMGFIPDVKKIIRATPPKEKRQTLFFSATIDNDVMYLSQSWTTDSISVKIEPDEVVVKNIEQIIYITTSEQKYALLYNIIISQNLDKVLVFTNRRDEARELGTKLYCNGIDCDVLSGEVVQKKRVQTLEDFRNGVIKVLVATDVAGRGIHVENISHVINYTLPEDPEDYVHRVGRTGRAGANGISISFATEDDSFQIPAIEKYIGTKMVYSYPDESLFNEPPSPMREAKEFAVAETYTQRKPYPNRNAPRRGPWKK